MGAYATAGPRVVTVSSDGTGDFKTVQAAVDSVAQDVDGAVIHLRAGTYRERVVVPEGKGHIRLEGEGAESTVITYSRNAHCVGTDGKEVGTFETPTVRVRADDFVAEGVTFENTAGDTGQALALSAEGDRQVYRNCRMIGWQDTLYANGGRQYFDHCYVEGRVDFIFGSATAVFDRCTIHSKNGGYVTAADTPAGQKHGYVFLNCTLTGEGKSAFLGRPWRWDRGSRADVAFVRCRMGPHIRAVGWDPWHHKPTTMNVRPGETTRYGEFGTMDLGRRPVDLSSRVAWAKKLTEGEAGELTVENVLGGEDGWRPAGESIDRETVR
jgi:pectinesterase